MRAKPSLLLSQHQSSILPPHGMTANAAITMISEVLVRTAGQAFVCPGLGTPLARLLLRGRGPEPLPPLPLAPDECVKVQALPCLQEPVFAQELQTPLPAVGELLRRSWARAN